MKFDAIVIGSGQGGNPLAFRLAGEGKTVALIEEKHIGGTCINTGCTPTKTMVASAQVAHYVANAKRWGINAENFFTDLAAVVARKNDVVSSFRSGQEKRASSQKTLQLFRTHARFVGPRQVQANDQILESERIFIDTGSRPAIPEIEGISRVPYLTNESILELQELPRHLVVLGGGYIGLEFGQIFRRFGSQVTIIQSAAQLVPREDAEIAAELHKILDAEGIRICLSSNANRIEPSTEGVKVTLAGTGEAIAASHLLVAVGRTPNTNQLGLDRTGVETDKHGYIKVNQRLETTAPGIWAIGDVKGGPAFTHISYHDYQVLYANIFEGKDIGIDNRIVPYCVFTDPQLGGVGLTEREARSQGYKLKIGKVPVSYVARAIERGETAGLMKVVINAENDHVLGGSILSADGGELVQILHTLMLARQPYTLLKGAIYIHPTMAEGFFSLFDSVAPA